MTRLDMIARIREARAALLETLALVPDDEWLSPGVVGEWSLRDVVAHLAIWCARAVTWLFQAERGVPLQLPRSNHPDWADVNARDVATQRDRPLDRILSDFHGAHEQLLQRLQHWTDDGILFDPRRFPELGGESLAAWVLACSAEHDAEHNAQIRQWLVSRASDAAG
ncbi:MAG: ClbS/DfsB family four-helix bundle protein [Thermoflexales bacterium]